MQHASELKKSMHVKEQMKYWRQTLTTYVYNHCNICNIPIYFCNIGIKQLQHTSKITKIFELYTCNMHHIPVQPPPSSSLGHRRATAVAGCKAGVLPCRAWRFTLHWRHLSALLGGASNREGASARAAVRHVWNRSRSSGAVHVE